MAYVQQFIEGEAMSEITLSKELEEKPIDASPVTKHDWDRYAKIATVCSVVFSTLGLLAGGAFGLYTYREQGLAQVEARNKVFHEQKYMQLKEVYGQLVDAAAAVGSSLSKEEALEKLRLFDTIYFGRAHIFVIDDAVTDGKIEFYRLAHQEVLKEEFPSRNLQKHALQLADICRQALDIRQSLHNKQ
jgi:hypothetical protein